MNYLTKADVFAIAEEILPTVQVRDHGLVHAAILRPQTTAFGSDAYPDVWTKAAALLQSLVIGHPLVDGNKRLGWVCTAAFLNLNDEEISGRRVDEAEALVVDVAAGRLDDIAEIAKRLHALGEEAGR